MFLIIVGTLIGTLVFWIRTQERVFIEQEMVAQLSYALEYMSRSFRWAKKQSPTDPPCIPIGYNYYQPSGYSFIRFINKLQGNDCQDFYLHENSLKHRKQGEVFDLLGPEIVVETLNFTLSGENEDDKIQPRVTVSMKISHSRLPITLSLQTTISQRDLDIEEY